ncbi:hypothetical protein AMELA_G00227060 [Ameiurus melas]|uniref:Uncharacterized protein n=1 Tax=Ameiurus melas TaxID=219545 RepID=A0A7J5ZZU7_AMEME|nr:hypothetical protein AMELA_G00227060 [Ameiurus melas]
MELLSRKVHVGGSNVFRFGTDAFWSGNRTEPQSGRLLGRRLDVWMKEPWRMGDDRTCPELLRVLVVVS